MRWRGVWVVVALLLVSGGVLGFHGEPREPVAQDAPLEVPTHVEDSLYPMVQDTLNNLFVEGGTNQLNRTVERLHGFNVTNSHLIVKVTGLAVVAQGTAGDYVISVEQEGEVFAECEWRLQRGAGNLGSAMTGIFYLCGLNDEPSGVAPEPSVLKNGNITLVFNHTGDLHDGQSHLNVHLMLYDEVEPEMHDLLADSSVGAFSAGDALWVAVWLVVAVWAFNRLMLFGGGVALIAAVAGAVPEVGPLFGPEQPALPVVLFIVALVYAAMSEVIQERREEREAAEDPSGGAS